MPLSDVQKHSLSYCFAQLDEWMEQAPNEQRSYKVERLIVTDEQPNNFRVWLMRGGDGGGYAGKHLVAAVEYALSHDSMRGINAVNHEDNKGYN